MKSKLFFFILLVVFLINSCSKDESEPIVEVESISLSHTELSMMTGDTIKLKALIMPENATDRRVSWYSSNETVVSVSDDGEVLAHKAGTSRIIAISEYNGLEADCIINVSQDIEDISFNSPDVYIRIGETKKIEVTIKPSNTNRNLRWESSNPNIFSVDNDGYITGISLGKAQVRASNTKGNILSSCTVNVVTPPSTYEGYECVDLGLPSGTLWARTNIGAKSELEAGTYFYWGETTNNDSSQSIYYIPESRYTDESGFEHTIPATYKDLGDIQGTQCDAAKIIMGGYWTIPEEDDVKELWENTTHEEVEKDGIKGIRFTAKNGNYIFLPAVGAKRPNGWLESYGVLCCITIATTKNVNHVGYWYYLTRNYGTCVMCQERDFRHQVRGIVKQWY